MLKRKAGFTLMELLVVVMIAAAVVVLSVPSYKKTQDRSRFDSAKGLLIDLGMAVQSLRADLSTVGKTFPVDGSNLSLSSSWQTGSLSNENTRTVDFTSNSDLGIALFAREYIPPIRFTSGSTYYGYSFTICADVNNPGGCCARQAEGNPNAVVCMSGGSDTYQGAQYLEDNSIVRIGT